MAEIFISYSNQDRAFVDLLVEALKQAGRSVWYDSKLSGGAVFSEEIEREIHAADVVLTVWSRSSISSRWVADESEIGRDEGKLVPISLDGSAPPIGFRQYQAIDFSDWNKRADDPLFAQLTASFDKVTGQAPSAPIPKREGARVYDQKSRKGVYAGGVVAVLVALGFAWKFVVPEMNLEEPVTDVASSAARDSEIIPVPGFGGRGAVAVMPFRNLSEDGANAYIGDGLTEDILTSVQAWGTFPVVSRSSTAVYKDQAVDIPTIASTLGVRYVVDGSVQRVGDQVRVSAQLIDAVTDAQIWSRQYDREMVDVFAIQDDITKEIVTAIVPEITRSESRRVADLHPESLEAWEMTMKAQVLITNGKYETSIEAKEMLEDALERDPGYALAHVRLAEVCHDLGEYFWQYQTEEASIGYHRLGIDHARRAVGINPNLVEARIWLGHLLLHAGQLSEGVVQLRKGVEINPSHGQMRAEYGFGLALYGDTDHALEEIEIALKLSPSDPRKDRITIFKSLALLYAEDYELASVQARQVIDTMPGSHLSIFAYIVEMSSLVRLGKDDEVARVAEEFRERFDRLNWNMLSRGAWTGEQLDQVERDLRSIDVVAN